MKLSVIIVNYNVRYFLEQALLSVRRAAAVLEVEIFVVDNNSSDGSVEMVRQKFPEVQLIANVNNPGFAKANNQAIRQAQGDYILLLNPDTVVEEDTFVKCVRFMDQHPDAGGLGVRMIDGTGKFLPESKRGFPSPWAAFCKTTGLSRLFPRSPVFNQYHLGYLDEFHTHEVDVLAGAFMLLRKSLLDEIGLLDETFFMYGEDIDLSYRIVKAGYKNYYFPATTIIHYKGESTKKGSLNYVKAFYNAMIIFAKKHFKGDKAKTFVAMLQMAIYFRALTTIAGNILRQIWLPLLDAAAILGGLLFIQDFWGRYYFQSPGYFDHPAFYYFNLPLYIIIWVGAIFISGGYVGRMNVGRVVRGILWGTLVLAAVYGFLPLTYRFSRALIILGAIWAILSTVTLRAVLHFLKFRNFEIGKPPQKNLLIVGSEAETARVMRLLHQAAVIKNVIGRVAVTNRDESPDTLGNIQALDDLVHIYNANEIIFCSKDVPAQHIMHWMTALSPNVNFKILPQKSLSIIGSSSRNTPGELYTIDIQFAIAQPLHQRNKRIFDLAVCLLALPLLPLIVPLVSSGFSLFKKWGRVAMGTATWVGYYQARKVKNLPQIKPGFLTPVDALQIAAIKEATAQRLNFLYAKDYTTGRDADILFKAWRKL